MPKLHTVYDFRTDQAIILGNAYILIAFAAFGFLLFFYTQAFRYSTLYSVKKQIFWFSIGHIRFAYIPGNCSNLI